MRSLSAAIIVLAGVGLMLGSVLFSHDHTALLIRACGGLFGAVGIIGWLAMVWCYVTGSRLLPGDKS